MKRECVGRGAAGVAGVSPLRGGSFARALSGGSPAGAAAAAHGYPALAAADPRRNVPDAARGELAQAVSVAPDASDRRTKVTGTRAGTPRIVRAGPSSLNGASHPASRDAPSARR